MCDCNSEEHVDTGGGCSPWINYRFQSSLQGERRVSCKVMVEFKADDDDGGGENADDDELN